MERQEALEQGATALSTKTQGLDGGGRGRCYPKWPLNDDVGSFKRPVRNLTGGLELNRQMAKRALPAPLLDGSGLPSPL